MAIFNLGTGVLGFLGACVLNGFIYYQIKRHIMTDLASMQYVSSMLRCCDKICSIKMSCEESEIQTLKQYYQVFRSLRGKIPNTFKTSFSDADFLGEYTKIIFMSDLRHYNAAIKKITAHKEEFHALYRQLGEIDMAISLLSFRKSIPFYTKPVFTENNEIIFEELYHPLLEKPVTNNGHIDKDSIVTGSNASGKSTFIKALAVNGILAQTLYTCMAKKFVLQNSLIVTSMAVKDDITAGDSYFITEIKSLKRILDCTAEIHCNCFIDEILKGTNTIERIAASAAVMRYLHETNCLCMVASHDIELTELLKSDYANYHFSEQI
ncbi:MAG: DNA mismatch repair protein MutS, partial [Eubacterium sp.]